MLVAAGDSIIFGSELDDEYGNYSQKTFPALLAKNLNLDYVCLATPGISNSGIARSVISFIENQKADIVVVCWTFANRQEFYIDNRFETLNGWVHNPDNKFNKKVEQFSKDYFNIASSSYFEMYATLKEILLLQNYLKVNDQRYIFTANSRFNLFDDKLLNTYKSAIDWSQWAWFEGSGFYDWAKLKKFSCGPEGHPLEQAHEEAFASLTQLVER